MPSLADLPLTYSANGGTLRRSGPPSLTPEQMNTGASGQPITVDANKGSWLPETIRGVALDTAAQVPGMAALGDALVGDQAGMRRRSLQAVDLQQQARALGPSIQTFDDAAKAGGGAANYAKAAAYQGAGAVPVIGAALLTDGVAGVGTGLVERGIARSAVRSAIESAAPNVAAREAAEAAAVDAAKALPGATDATVSAAKARATSAAAKLEDAQVKNAMASKFVAPAANSTAQKAAGSAASAATFFPSQNLSNIGDPNATPEQNAGTLNDPNATQADALKLTLGTIGASLIMGVRTDGLAAKIGGGAAGETVAKDALNFTQRLKKIGVDSAVQGVAQGSAGAAATAVQLATHKWVNNNVDLMSPEATNSYLASFIGQGLGAVGFHAAGAGLRESVGLVGSAAKGGYAALRKRLGDFAQKRADSRLKPGEEVPDNYGDKADAPAGDGYGAKLRSAFNNAKEGVGNFASKFTKHADSVQSDDPMAEGNGTERLRSMLAGADAAHEAFVNPVNPADTIGPAAQSYTLPHGMELPPLQSLLVRSANPEWLHSLEPIVVDHLGGLFERVARGETTVHDNPLLDAIKNNPNSGITEDTYNKMAAVGPDVDSLQKMLQHVDPKDENAPAADTNDAGQIASANAAGEQTAPVAGEREGDELGGALDEHSAFDQSINEHAHSDARDAMATDSPLTSLNNLRETMLAAKARRDAAANGVGFDNRGEMVNLSDKRADAALAEHQDAYAKALEAHSALQSKLRKDTLSGSNIFDESRQVDKAKGLDGPAAFKARIESPNYVETKEGFKLSGGADRRQLVDLGNLMLQQRAKLRAEGVVDAEGNVTGRDALLGAMGDLHQLGVHLKASTFSPGDIKTKDGERLATLYDGGEKPAPKVSNAIDIRELRVAAKPRADKQEGAQPGLAGAERQRALYDAHKMQTGMRTIGERDYVPGEAHTSRIRHAEGELMPGARVVGGGKQVGTRTLVAHGVLHGEDKVDHAATIDERSATLVPREKPPSSVAPEGKKGTAFVPSQDVVSDVRTNTPYAKMLNKVIDKNKNVTPREKALLAHEAGVKIGTAELERQRAAGMSDRRFAVETARLHDKASGDSMRYFKDARAGKFDSASVTHAKRDAAEQEGYDEQTYKQNKYPDNSSRAKAERRTGEKPVAAERPSGERASLEAHDAKRPKADDIQHDVTEVGEAKDGEHDLKATQDLANGVLKSLGIDRQVKVIEDARSTAGGYGRAGEDIRLGAGLHGAERIEVLAHEIGHHVLWDEIAKHVEGGWEKVKGLTLKQGLDALQKGNPELYNALRADFDAHRSGFSAFANAKEERIARAPINRAGRVQAELAAQRAENYANKENKGAIGDAAWGNDANMFHEWIADNIARALTQDKPTQSLIGKFFHGIAQALKATYEKLFGTPEAQKWAPAPSVEKWVKQMLDANREAVSEALGTSQTMKGTELAIRAAVHAANVDPTKVNESAAHVASFIASPALGAAERKLLDQQMNRPAVWQFLQKHYKDNPVALKAMSDAADGMQNTAAYAYLAWKQGELMVGPRGQAFFHTLADDFARVIGLAGKGDMAQRIFTDMSNGTIAAFHDANKTYSVHEIEARNRGKLQRALDTGGKMYDKLMEPVSKAFDSSMSRMYHSGIPGLRAIATGVLKPGTDSGDRRDAARDIVRKTAVFHTQLSNAFNGLSDEHAAGVIKALQMQGKFFDGKGNKVSVEDALAGTPPAARAAYQQVRGIMDKMHDYATSLGVKMAKRPDFFPVLLETVTKVAEKKGQVGDLTKLLSQPHFEDAIKNLPFFKEDGKPSSKGIVELVKDLVDRATAEPGVRTNADGTPTFKSQNMRSMQFVYDHGTEEDIHAFVGMQSKDPAYIFSRYVDPLVKHAEYTHHYGEDGMKLKGMLAAAREQGATPAQLTEASNVVKAAYGLYGVDGSPILRAISPHLADKLKGPRALNTIAAIKAYENSRILGLSILPSMVDPLAIILRTGGSLKTAWPGIKLGMQAVFSKSTRQQLEHMLAMLTQTDEVGISGPNDAGGAGTKKANEWVFKLNGMTAFVKQTRYMAMLAAHSFLIEHALKASDGKTAGDATSDRYLRELRISPDDIAHNGIETKTMANGKSINMIRMLSDAERIADPKAAESDDRVRNALADFIDQSILRPTSIESPLWHADPYMGLLTQYKSFAYAMYSQLHGRMTHEMKHGNNKVLLPALAYIPGTIIGEMLRSFIQYGPAGNPTQASDGAADWMERGVQRSSMFFTPAQAALMQSQQEASRGFGFGTSQLGPAANQVMSARANLSTVGQALPFEASTPGLRNEATAYMRGTPRRGGGQSAGNIEAGQPQPLD